MSCRGLVLAEAVTKTPEVHQLSKPGPTSDIITGPMNRSWLRHSLDYEPLLEAATPPHSTDIYSLTRDREPKLGSRISGLRPYLTTGSKRILESTSF